MLTIIWALNDSFFFAIVTSDHSSQVSNNNSEQVWIVFENYQNVAQRMKWANVVGKNGTGGLANSGFHLTFNL